MSEAPSAIVKLATLTQELGYKALIKDDGVIYTAMSGFNVAIFHFPESVQLFIGFNREKQDRFGVEHANSLNMKNRFVKCYTRENSISFEQDFFFDPFKDDAKDLLERIFSEWESTIEVARGALRAAKSDEAKEQQA